MARTRLSDERIRDVKDIAGHELDWNSVLKKAEAHDVSSLIYYALKEHSLAEYVPADFLEKTKLKYYDNAVRNIAAEKAVTRLSEVIEHKIVFVKGADLFQSLYPSTGIRSMGDVDILVEKEHAEAVWYSLVKNGFTSEEGPEIQYRSEMHENLCSHLPKLMTDAFTVEVHWNIFGIAKLYPVTQTSFEKAVQVRDNIYVLSNEMKLVHLCNHFRRHLRSGASLRHLCDINELIVKHGNEINWDDIDSAINNTDIKSDVSAALTYASEFLGTEVPEKYIDKDVINSNTFELGMVLKMNTGTNGEVEVFRNKFKSIPGIQNKLSYLYRIAIPPRKWVTASFGNNDSDSLAKSYSKYYSYLFKKITRS
ncbi:MAG: nucleotidyltransferase family protein [Candidatus Kapaibacterium sp.]